MWRNQENSHGIRQKLENSLWLLLRHVSSIFYASVTCFLLFHLNTIFVIVTGEYPFSKWLNFLSMDELTENNQSLSQIYSHYVENLHIPVPDSDVSNWKV